MAVRSKQEVASKSPMAWPTLAMRAASNLLSLLALSLGLVAQAYADTPVQGAIAVDTQWTVDSAPYVLTGDVVVQGGATLTISPGVVVYMAQGSGLRIQSGSVRANGTSASPVRVLSDKVRLGQPATPGDWNQWVFTTGTVNTRLDYVSFAHGRGLVVNGSAPVFNHLKIENQLGPAVEIDLAASPSGVGNSASGNTFNAVAVPAGDIAGNVRWGLRGIPYLVRTGMVSVGASPTINSISPAAIQQGETATYTLTGTRLTGFTELGFEQAGLSAQLLPGATATQAQFTISATAETPVGSALLLAMTDAGLAKSGPLEVTQAQPTLTSLSPAKLFTGQGSVSVAVVGRGFLPTSKVIVGGNEVATTYQSATEAIAMIEAPAAAANLSVAMRTPDPLSPAEFLTSNSLLLPVETAKLSLKPASATVANGFSRTFTVGIPYPAPSGGMTVALVSSVPSVGSVPSTALVPAGQTTADVSLNATGLGGTVLTASKVGFVSAQSSVTVVAPPTLTLSPASLSVGQGRSVEFTLQSSVAAGPSGLEVSLVSSDPAVVSVPAAVNIASGSKIATVTVTTASLGNATLTAQAFEYAGGSAAISVRPASILLPEGALVAPGLTRSLPLTLSDPAPAGGLLVALQSSNPSIASVPATFTVPAGETAANFNLTGVAVGSVNLSATAIDYQSATTAVVVETVNIGIGSPSLSNLSVPVERTHSYVLTLSRPAPRGGVVIDLSTTNPSIATVAPSSITIAEGEITGNAMKLSLTGITKGGTTLVASSPGMASASLPVTVTGKPVLRIRNANNQLTAVAGKGMRSYPNEVSVGVTTDNLAYLPAQQPGGYVVTLINSDPSKLTVPETVTIPANESEVIFPITGVDLTS
ncbi:hypothetical protein, partial [Pseudoxanthomonas sacheonensis]